MTNRGLTDLFQNFYSDENFKSNLIKSPEEAISSGQYQLTSEEKNVVKQFISNDWSHQSLKYQSVNLKRQGESCGCGGCHSCNACGCKD